MSTKAARRYAGAMLQSAVERDILEEIKSDMEMVFNTISESKDLVLFLKSPIIKRDVKRKALTSIFKNHVREETFILIKLLLDKGRESLLLPTSKSFLELYNEHKGIIDVGVYAAYDLSDEHLKSLSNSLEKSTGKKVQLKFNRDESLRGGMAVRIDDTVIDGTVKHKISQLKNKFAANAAN